MNSKISLLDANDKTASANIIRLNNEIEEDNQKIELLKDEIEKRNKKRENVFLNKKKFEEELSQKEDALSKIVSTLDERGLEIESLKKNIDENNERKFELKNENSSTLATIEAEQKQLEDKVKQNDKNISLKDSLNSDYNELNLELEKNNKELIKINNSICDVENKLKNVQDTIDVLDERKTKINQDLMTIKAKHNYLVNLENENEGYSKSVKAILDYSKNNSKVYGTIAGIISTDEKYEYAIEIALGGFIQNIVVKDELIAKNLITYLNDNSLGRVTFLPLDNIVSVSNSNNKALKYDGVIGFASDLVTYDLKYEKAVKLALANTLIVNNVDNAITISKKIKNTLRIVTLSGELISQTGSITGGRNSIKSGGVIGRKEKIVELKEKISKTQEELEKIKEQIVKLEEQKSTVKIEYDNIQPQKEELVIKIATLTEKRENVTKEIQKIEEQKENYKNMLQSIQENINTLKDNIEINNKEIFNIEVENSKNQDIVDEYTRFNKEKQNEIDILNEDVVNLKVSLSSFDETVLSIDEMKDKIENDIKNFEASISKRKEEINLLNNQKEEIVNEINILKNEIESSSKAKEEYEQNNDKLKEQKNSYNMEMEQIDSGIVITLNTLNSIKEKRAKEEAKRVKFEMELTNLKNKMWDEYELTISSSKALITEDMSEINIKQVEREANKLRKEIKEIGDVDVSSIEEYQKTKERYDFIINQKNDLEETKKKLENLISNMTSIMKQQFSKNFKIITENFDATFKELFGGGKAELKLSDENDVLNSGIEIEVQPPGKKLQSMLLLSGGERALTATALLFAILQIKSPPFCILDEIEAALDDVNVHRFAEYIKEYSKKNQFIVITHRKGTMEVASSVYGITMQEYGISKVVSMKMK